MIKELAEKTMDILEGIYDEVELVEVDGNYFIAVNTGNVQVINKVPDESELAEMFASLCSVRVQALYSIQPNVDAPVIH